MSINATFYKFNKRKNSTAIPTGAGDIVAVDLKGGVDILNPTFIIAVETMPRYTYLLFEGRFYYITGVRSIRTGLWEISATVDVLSTYKPNIKNTSAYVRYMTNGDSRIVDDRLAVVSGVSIDKNNVTIPVVSASLTGTYLVAITGEQNVGVYAMIGGLSNLMLNYDTFSNIWDSKVSAGDLGQAVLSIGKQLVSSGNLAENIRSCIWTPLDIAEGDLVQLKVGMYDTGVGAFKVTNKIKTYSYSINIPWQFSDWRNTSPYTQVYLYLPFIGTINYSSANLVGITALSVKLSVNMFTGEVAYEVSAGNEILGTYSASTGVSIAIGQSNVNPMSLASGVVGAATGIATGNYAGAIACSIAALVPNSSTAGSMSGGATAGLERDIVCYTVCHNTVENPSDMATVKGLPYFAVTSLANENGYIETENFSVVDTYSNMTSTEKDMVNDLMDGGVYLE